MNSNAVTRVWHGRTRAEHADEYLQFLIATGVADYRSVDGNLSVEVWRQVNGQYCDFWTVTKWDSFDSITKFAGEDLNKAKYYPDDSKYLLEFEPTVQHYETFVFG
jgi:heme-degrading monooxygenase HmoA